MLLAGQAAPATPRNSWRQAPPAGNPAGNLRLEVVEVEVV